MHFSSLPHCRSPRRPAAARAACNAGMAGCDVDIFDLDQARHVSGAHNRSHPTRAVKARYTAQQRPALHIETLGAEATGATAIRAMPLARSLEHARRIGRPGPAGKVNRPIMRIAISTTGPA